MSTAIRSQWELDWFIGMSNWSMSCKPASLAEGWNALALKEETAFLIQR